MADVQRKETEFTALTDSCEEVLSTCDKFPDDTENDHEVLSEKDKISKRWNELNSKVQHLVKRSDDAAKSFFRYTDHVNQANTTLSQITETLDYNPSVGVDIEETQRQLSRVKVRLFLWFKCKSCCSSGM